MIDWHRLARFDAMMIADALRYSEQERDEARRRSPPANRYQWRNSDNRKWHPPRSLH